MELSDERYFSLQAEFLLLFEDFVTQMIRNNCYCELYLFLSQLFIELARIFLYCGKNNVTGLTLLSKIEFLLRTLVRTIKRQETDGRSKNLTHGLLASFGFPYDFSTLRPSDSGQNLHARLCLHRRIIYLSGLVCRKSSSLSLIAKIPFFLTINSAGRTTIYTTDCYFCQYSLSIFVKITIIIVNTGQFFA